MSFHPVSLSLAAWTLLAAAHALNRPSDPGLRSVLLNERNQELIEELGTRYEIVYPHRISRDWARGLDTYLTTQNGTVLHVPETTLVIETFEYKLQLDLQLNTKLFVPTLVQLLYQKHFSPIAVHKLPENCYYHATIRNHPEAKAALQTCNGIRGVLYLADKTFFIHPLHGNHSGKHPHLLYHYFPEEDFNCGSTAATNEDILEHGDENYDWHRKKFVELAVVIDQSLFRKFRSLPHEVLSAAVEIINHVDLLYRPLNTSVSLVYVELWMEDQMAISASNMSATLNHFEDYVARRISRISVDTTHLLTGMEFEEGANGLAFLDSICTNKAVGISQVRSIYEPHLSAFVLAHMVGHNLGMDHDQSGCDCPDAGGCIMENNMPMLSSTSVSQCSVQAYHRTLDRGYGACLYNMPAMRVSICGNNILEEPEQCDCGTVEECLRSNPCCDPITCRLIKHAQCSSGPCCRKCKLLSPDHLCRPSKGECDIPEFCDGTNGQCPLDVFKRNGAVCSGGLGYCFEGECPVTKLQCQDIWGTGADSADAVCFDRLNVQGTPNGNCGTDGAGGIRKCPSEHSLCGFLQCQSGSKNPMSGQDDRVQFVVHKIAAQGTVHECKAKTFPTSELSEGLVRDGTKCGYQKLCFNQTCTSLKNLVSGKCPNEDEQNACSGHGICTNANTCFCDEGWKGRDCATVDEDWRQDYHDVAHNASHNTHHYADNELGVNPNLALTVIAAATVIAVGIVLLLLLFFFFYRRT